MFATTAQPEREAVRAVLSLVGQSADDSASIRILRSGADGSGKPHEQPRSAGHRAPGRGDRARVVQVRLSAVLLHSTALRKRAVARSQVAHHDLFSKRGVPVELLAELEVVRVIEHGVQHAVAGGFELCEARPCAADCLAG